MSSVAITSLDYGLRNMKLATPQLKGQDLDLAKLQKMAAENAKQRYKLIQEPVSEGGPDAWWIRATQGHSLAAVKLDDLKPILVASDVPMAVHGTNHQAWKAICTQKNILALNMTSDIPQPSKVCPR